MVPPSTRGVMSSLPGARSRPGATRILGGAGAKSTPSCSALPTRTPRLCSASAASSKSRWRMEEPLSTDFSSCSGRRLVSTFAVADTTTFTAASVEPPKHAPKNTTIVGGGPTGLATAIMLARLGYQSIQVLERLPAPPTPDSEEWGDPDRSYGLGINGRGQKTLLELGCWDRIDTRCADVNGSLTVMSNGEHTIRPSTYKKYITKIIQRDRLVSCLLEEIQENYSGQVTVRHGVECTAVEWRDGSPASASTARLTCTSSEEGAEQEVEVEAEFLVGADGFRSTIPTAMEKAPGSNFKRKVFEDTNPRVYKTLKFFTAPEWRFDMNLGAESADKKVGVTLQGLPVKEGYMAGLLLFKPGNEAIEGISTAEEAREFIATQFPAFLPYVPEEEFEKLASRPVVKLPVFQYCTPSLHHGTNTVLVGDCIHTVKPYFGLGVNSAFEDVSVLQRSLQSSDHRLEAALPSFTATHKEDAKSLVRMSRRFDTGGFVGFVLPLILDGIFSQAAPWLFGPNNIRLLQNHGLRFSEIARKKLIDRVLQVSIIAGVLALLGKLAHMLFGSASRYVASLGTAV